MAQRGLESDQETLCSGVLDPAKDPVVSPCGHDGQETHVRPRSGQETSMLTDSVGHQAAPGPADEPEESPNVFPAEPRTREDFLKYWCQITLDPNTANARVMLSEGNRRATQTEEDQVYPSHPDRFVDGSLVLSKEALSGRHYWEVERSGGAVSVAVAYRDVSRTGTGSTFGCSYKSWALDCFDGRYVARHMYIQAAKPHPVSSRVGVYLDHGAGVLAFYSVSETMTLLHRVQTTFSQPLYAGLWLHGHKSSAVVC